MMDPVRLMLTLNQSVLVMVNGQDVIVQVSMEAPSTLSFFKNVVIWLIQLYEIKMLYETNYSLLEFIDFYLFIFSHFQLQALRFTYYTFGLKRISPLNVFFFQSHHVLIILVKIMEHVV